MVRKPKGIDERLEQLRPPVPKADGSTDSERYLARLAERSFLNLWSYPSPYRNQKMNGAGDGKELCDLLVVCGKHVVIFSEKTVAWPGGDLLTAWFRWARKAIRDSTRQTGGAERWIRDMPEAIFLDRACTVAFPIDLPSPSEMVVHRVIVANGAFAACREHMPATNGSLLIDPSVIGVAHWDGAAGDARPFHVGDVDPDGSFVHVFNEFTLDVVMSELDTITDFTDYLSKKARFVRSGQLALAYGEENLLAYYATQTNAVGDHDFAAPAGGTPATIQSDRYRRFRSNPRYAARRKADRISYLWDRLIETFTDHMLGGTSIVLDGFDFDLRKNELATRYMALEPRFLRRSHGQAVADALERGKKSDRFFRVMFAPADSKANETAFFIATMKYLPWMDDKGGYEWYRVKRTEAAAIYARGVLERFPHLRRIIGISMEPPGQDHGGSEDLLYCEQFEWTEEQRQQIRSDCKDCGVLQNLKERRFKAQEFPDVEEIIIQRPPVPATFPLLNRKQRRALKAKGRKRKSS